MHVRRSAIAVLATLCLAASAGAAEKTVAPADGARREALADMLLQLEQAQVELRELRGKVEVQAHEVEALKARQRDLIADIDRRLSELERRGAAPAEGAAREAAAGAPAVADTAPTNLAQEQQEYDAAFALLKQGQYERASKRFRDFIRAHPKSPLADNAQYWVGESAYVVRNFKQALSEFSKVVQSHPRQPEGAGRDAQGRLLLLRTRRLGQGARDPESGGGPFPQHAGGAFRRAAVGENEERETVNIDSVGYHRPGVKITPSFAQLSLYSHNAP